MRTATEVRMRQNEWWLTDGAALARFAKQMQGANLDLLINAKVPLIKYGRQKRRYRRLFPRTDGIRIKFDA